MAVRPRRPLALWIPTAFVLLVAGCAAVDAPEADLGTSSEQAKTEAIKAQVVCMRVQTSRLDDGVSNAEKIGQAVARACQSESDRAAKIFVAGKSPEAQAEFFKSAPVAEADMATRVVRHMRSEQP